MAHEHVQVAPDGAGSRIDTREFARAGVGSVEQQVVAIGQGDDTEVVKVATAAPGGADPGLVTRNIPSGTQNVAPTALAPDQATESSLVSIIAELTSLLARLPAALGAGGGGLKVEGVAGGTAVPVQAAALPLPAGAATEATAAAIKTGTDKIPASPATDRATAAAPAAARLSDGAAFYKATTPADTQPVSIAAAVPVTDNAGSLTMDSPQLPAALVGGRLDVVVGAALPAGANAIGKLAANSGVDIGDVDVTSLPALPAGNNNIGDVDVVSLPALPAGNNNIGDVDIATMPASSRTADTVCATPDGKYIVVDGVAYTVLRAYINLAASGELIPLHATKKNRIVSMIWNNASNADGTMQIKSGGAAGTALGGAYSIRVGAGGIPQLNPYGWFENANVNENLYAVITGLSQLSGVVLYIQV